MRPYIHSLMVNLESADPFLGVPLVLLGLAMMFMGWNFQKPAVPFIFVLLGLMVGHMLFDRLSVGLGVGALIGLALAAISFFAPKYAIAVLGGLCGAFVLSGYLTFFEDLILPETVRLGVAGFGFVGGAAMAFIMFREMVMIVTAFAGTLFLICGLNAILPQASQPLYATVTSFLTDYPALLVPFLIGGPTLIGTLIQMSNANRTDAGAS